MRRVLSHLDAMTPPGAQHVLTFERDTRGATATDAGSGSGHRLVTEFSAPMELRRHGANNQQRESPGERHQGPPDSTC